MMFSKASLRKEFQVSKEHSKQMQLWVCWSANCSRFSRTVGPWRNSCDGLLPCWIKMRSTLNSWWRHDLALQVQPSVHGLCGLITVGEWSRTHWFKARKTNKQKRKENRISYFWHYYGLAVKGCPIFVSFIFVNGIKSDPIWSDSLGHAIFG